MPRTKQTKTLAINQTRRFLAAVAFVFVAATALSIYLNHRSLHGEYKLLAATTARSFFMSTVVTRRWNAMHKGVYVPVTESILPNPYLEDPLRDLTTTSGLKLTKINPAYMTRLIAQLLEQDKGIRVNITSLNPLRPANAPDERERAALGQFEKGLKEKFMLTGPDAAPMFWYMAPLQTEKACLRCHGKQGFKLGDVRGGIRISFSFRPFITTMNKVLQQLYIVHAVFLCMLLGIVCLLGSRLIAKISGLEEARGHIQKLEGLLPICSGCKKIRPEGLDPEDQESWVQIEKYIHEKTATEFTHGLCPECIKKTYPDLAADDEPDAKEKRA